MNNIILHLFHILFVGGLFLYIGVKQKNMPNYMFNIILFIGVFILLYHGYKIYMKIKNKQNPWVNLFHILVVAPLLIYIGHKKQDSPRYIYEFIFMLSFAAIGYHAYYMIT